MSSTPSKSQHHRFTLIEHSAPQDFKWNLPSSSSSKDQKPISKSAAANAAKKKSRQVKPPTAAAAVAPRVPPQTHKRVIANTRGVSPGAFAKALANRDQQNPNRPKRKTRFLS